MKLYSHSEASLPRFPSLLKHSKVNFYTKVLEILFGLSPRVPEDTQRAGLKFVENLLEIPQQSQKCSMNNITVRNMLQPIYSSKYSQHVYQHPDIANPFQKHSGQRPEFTLKMLSLSRYSYCATTDFSHCSGLRTTGTGRSF